MGDGQIGVTDPIPLADPIRDNGRVTRYLHHLKPYSVIGGEIVDRVPVSFNGKRCIKNY